MASLLSAKSAAGVWLGRGMRGEVQMRMRVGSKMEWMSLFGWVSAWVDMIERVMSDVDEK